MAGISVRVRPVALGDQEQLVALAGLLDTVNLPRDPAVVGQLIATSVKSFAGQGGKDASYTFVAERGIGREAKLLGTASLFAFHGMPDDPHYYLRVEEQSAFSKQLSAERKRTVLKLGRDLEPWTEFGGLVVHPESRGAGVGKLLVAIRLLYIAMHPNRFCRRLLAELLPPRRPDGGNAFWDAVGKPLTGLDYYRADLLCRTDKEFIEAFFPPDELVAELLPAEARALIGVEGPATTPVRALLRRAGFKYLHTIDPFDAGPHDGVDVAQVGPIQRTRKLVKLDLPPGGPGARQPTSGPEARQETSGGPEARQPANASSEPQSLLVATSQVQAAVIPALVLGEGLRCYHLHADGLDLRPGDPCWAMPLDW